ncbi:MAG: 2,4-dihydroxyhept-2-ene-1,7-dioic acid aldolase [Acidobacteria bacterium]|nr:2,4-dihydroxyhept-2-ene-1,7-dioic acid aldolase [Acidobacteriota bacterium]
MTTPLVDRIRRGEYLRGTFLNLGSALVAEVCALGGCEWLLVDLEHGAGGEEGLLGQVLAARAHGVPVIARTESAERIRVGHLLDLGVEGVMFPRLDTPDEVRRALSHLWYPPRGDRGIAGYNRARQFGGDGLRLDQVNDGLCALVQVESVSALENLEEIAGIEGVDVLFIGPADLSAALGVPGQLTHPRFVKAMDRVVETALRHGVAAGILVGDPNLVEAARERGFSFVSVGSDSSLLRGALRQAFSLE